MTESPLESAQRELNDRRPDWYRSPIVLLGALVVVAAILAFVITSAGGDDETADVSTGAASADDTAPDAGEEPAPAAAPTEAPAVPEEDEPEATEVDPAASLVGSFGGDGIDETAAVLVQGEVLPAFESAADDPALGLTAPIITAASLSDGSLVELGPGTPRIVGFFAHWCPHCQEEVPQLIAWLEANPLPAGAEFVAVSTIVDPSRDNYPPSAWFNAEGWAHPVVVDDPANSVISSYGFRGIPAFIAIDAEGTVVARLGGNLGVEGFEQLVAAIS